MGRLCDAVAAGCDAVANRLNRALWSRTSASQISPNTAPRMEGADEAPPGRDSDSESDEFPVLPEMLHMASLQPVGGGPPVPAASAAVLAEQNASGPLQMQGNAVVVGAGPEESNVRKRKAHNRDCRDWLEDSNYLPRIPTGRPRSQAPADGGNSFPCPRCGRENESRQLLDYHFFKRYSFTVPNTSGRTTCIDVPDGEGGLEGRFCIKADAARIKQLKTVAT